MEVKWALERAWMLVATVPYILGGWLLRREYLKAEDPIVRRQLQWLSTGSLCGILPFALLYVLPYAFGAVPGFYQKMAVLSVGLLLFTCEYLIVRYQLL